MVMKFPKIKCICSDGDGTITMHLLCYFFHLGELTSNRR